MLKARYQSGDHSVTFKYVEVDEMSNQSYVGLSQASFDANPRMRYGMTQYDVMNNDGDQTSLTYKGSFGNFNVVASTWSNDYHRDWFKVDKANNKKAHAAAPCRGCRPIGGSTTHKTIIQQLVVVSVLHFVAQLTTFVTCLCFCMFAQSFSLNMYL